MYNLCISTKGIKNKKLTEMKNGAVFSNVYFRLIADALNRYHFEGLPDTISERVLLESLLFYGAACIFEENGALLCLPCAPSGNGYNIYGDPLSVWVFSKNGNYNKEVKLLIDGVDDAPILKKGNGVTFEAKGRGVIIWENMTRYPFANDSYYYASCIADSYRTLDVNRNWLKSPFIPVCEESLVPSVKQLFTKILENNEIIPVSTGILDISKFDIKQLLGVSDNVKEVIEVIEWYEAQYKQLCGTDANGQIDKKGENLISDEIHANDEATEKNRDKIIEYINKQLELCNSIFGTNIKCMPNINEEKETTNKEDGKDGGLDDITGDERKRPY